MKKNNKISQCLYNHWPAILLLAIMFFVALFSSKGAFGIPGDSGTVDEIAHIPSGYSYVKYLDFRLNPEHPPVAKALAGIPLAIQDNIHGLKDDWSWNGINQWESGWYLLYEAGNDPAIVLFWARLPMMLLMIGLGIFLYKWATELYGKKIGLISLAIFAFYPDIIAHGRLVTTDIAAAFGYLITIYYFDKALKNITFKSVLIAGVVFGVAQSLKFSVFLLFGVLLLMAFIRAYLDMKAKTSTFGESLKKYLLAFIKVSAISLITIWIIYIPFVWNTPKEIEHQLIESNLTNDPKTQYLRNFLHLLEGNNITRALGHYLLGVMLVFARVAGGNATYAIGHLSDKSIPWYFPLAWMIKTPISVILLLLASLFMVASKRVKRSLDDIWTLSVILLPIVVYWGFTLKGSLNIGIRHLMPTVPFVILLIGYAIAKIFENKAYKKIQYVVLGLIGLQILSVLSYYPGFIGYFNEFVPRNQRYKYLIDSSLDWGQDLLRLKEFVDENNIEEIKVDYFGGSVPSYYIPESKEWHSSYGPTTGWLAVSATFYQSSKLVGEKEGKWSYHWLDEYVPEKQIGGSILVYHITPEMIKEKPPVSPYPINTYDLPSENTTRKVGL